MGSDESIETGRYRGLAGVQGGERIADVRLSRGILKGQGGGFDDGVIVVWAVGEAVWKA